MSPERRILIGRMVGAFGISGEIKCQSFADPPQQLLKYKPLILVHEGREQVLESLSGRMTAKGPVIRLSDVDDRDAAQAVEVSLAVGVPDSAAFAVRQGDRQAAVGVHDV